MKRGSPRIAAFLSALVAVIALCAVTGCAAVQAQFQDGKLIANVERADTFIAAAELELPAMAPYTKPVREEFAKAARDGALNENDLRPALRLLKSEFDAYLENDADLDPERRDRLLQWASLIEKFVRTFLPPEEAEAEAAPTVLLDVKEASPVLPGVG